MGGGLHIIILHQEFGDSKIQHEDLSGHVFNLFIQMNPHSFETSESQLLVEVTGKLRLGVLLT